MKCVALSAWHVRIPLKKKVRHASFVRDQTDSLVVCCRLDNGILGWGEGLPRAYVTGETIDTAWQHLETTDWSQALGCGLSSLADALAACDAVRLPRPAEARDCFGNVVRCAVELSVLDAVARACDEPFSAVTRLVGETHAIRHSAAKVRYSGALTPEGLFRDWLTAWKLRLFHFAQSKVKVGVAGFDDARTVASLRRVVGKCFDIRIDANEAWTPVTLESKLAPLLPFGISAVEQPVPHGEVDGLSKVREKLTVPIMLDESLASLSDARRAIERGTCDLFNIRLSKCGGFLSSLRIAAMAHSAGLGCQLGCQVGETGILSAAGRHFACSVAGLKYLEGSFDRFLVRERLTKEDVTFGFGGWAPALAGPGLGITVDARAVERVAVRKWQTVL